MKIAPYGCWKSPITSDLIVANASVYRKSALMAAMSTGLNPGRRRADASVVVRYLPGSTKGQDMVPQPFNARTRVHEYGGGAWTIAEGTIYFSNYEDQRHLPLR